MKFSVILSIVCIGIGIAIGWISKPDPATADSETPEVAPPKTSTRSETPAAKPPVEKSDRNPTPPARVVGRTNPEEMTDERRATMAKYQNRFGDMMKKRRMSKLDARISKLVAQLNLTPEQEAALREDAEKNLEGIDSMMSGDFDPSKLGSLTGDSSLDDALAEILTDEQKEENEALKERELSNKVEAKALKNLANLSSLDMTQEQKDAAYDILYKQAEESTSNASPASGILSMVSEGLGIELDAGDLGIDAAELPDGSDPDASEDGARDPQKMMARMRENQQKQIDTKVEAMQPILNETQLDQYRKSLEIKRGGILGGILGGFGAGE